MSPVTLQDASRGNEMFDNIMSLQLLNNFSSVKWSVTG